MLKKQRKTWSNKGIKKSVKIRKLKGHIKTCPEKIPVPPPFLCEGIQGSKDLTSGRHNEFSYETTEKLRKWKINKDILVTKA